MNRQGADIGTQYRSAIYYHGPDQRIIAEECVRSLEEEHIFPDPIVTEIQPAEEFYIAEQYHQSFFKNNPYQPYCQFIVAPKVIKLRQKHAELLKTIPSHKI